MNAKFINHTIYVRQYAKTHMVRINVLVHLAINSLLMVDRALISMSVQRKMCAMVEMKFAQMSKEVFVALIKTVHQITLTTNQIGSSYRH